MTSSVGDQGDAVLSRIGRRLRRWGWRAVVIAALAAAVGALPAVLLPPGPILYETLVTVQATVLGFLIVVVTFVFEQQRSAVEASLRSRDNTLYLIFALALVGVIVSALGAVLSLTLVSSSTGRRMYGMAAGAFTASGLSLGLTAIVVFAASLRPHWATDRLVAGAIQGPRSERRSKRMDSERGHVGERAASEADVGQLGRLAIMDGENSNFVAFKCRIDGLSELSRALGTRGSSDSGGSGARRVDPVVDTLFLVIESLIGRRDFALYAIDALEKALSPTLDRVDVDKLVDRLVALLRRVWSKGGLSSRVMRAIIRAPVQCASGPLRSATRPLIHVALDLATDEAAPRDITERAIDGICDLLDGEATDVPSIHGAVMDLKARNYSADRIGSAAGIVITAFVRAIREDSSSRDAVLRAFLTEQDPDPLESLIVHVREVPDPTEYYELMSALMSSAVARALATKRATIAEQSNAHTRITDELGSARLVRWLRSVQDHAYQREEMLAQWLAVGLDSMSTEAAEEELQKTSAGKSTVSRDLAAKLGSALLDLSRDSGSAEVSEASIDWERLSDAVVKRCYARIDGESLEIISAAVLRERLHLMMTHGPAEFRRWKLADALFVVATGEQLRVLMESAGRDHGAKHAPDDINARLQKLVPRLRWSNHEERPLRAESLDAKHVAQVLDDFWSELRKRATRNSIAEAMVGLVVLDLLDRDGSAEALRAFVKTVANLDRDAIGRLRLVEPLLHYRLKSVVEWLAESGPKHGAGRFTPYLAAGGCMKLSKDISRFNESTVEAAASAIVGIVTESESAGESSGQRAELFSDMAWRLIPSQVWDRATQRIFDSSIYRPHAVDMCDDLIRLSIPSSDIELAASLHAFWLALRSKEIADGKDCSRLVGARPETIETSFLAGPLKVQAHGTVLQRIGVVHVARGNDAGDDRKWLVDVGDKIIDISAPRRSLRGGEIVAFKSMLHVDESGVLQENPDVNPDGSTSYEQIQWVHLPNRLHDLHGSRRADARTAVWTLALQPERWSAGSPSNLPRSESYEPTPPFELLDVIRSRSAERLEALRGT
jgi:hypothetical protein